LQNLSSVSHNEKQEVPFLSLARFGPGTVVLLSCLVVLSFMLFRFRFNYLGILVALVAIAIFSVKSFERIEFGKAEEKKLIGQRCFVVRKISPDRRGIVRVYRDDGKLDPELWSAESVTSRTEIDENQTAIIVGMRSIILLVEPQ
jgi:membrane protein implicated in regulation of membrane protease activity